MTDPVETPMGTVRMSHFQPREVRHQVMLGPKFVYALFNPSERLHAVARAFMGYLRDGELPYRRLVLDDHIVDEAATRLKKQGTIRQAVSFLETLDESSVYQFEHVPEDVFTDATATFADWTDQAGSLTDFVVVAHMDVLEIDHLLTFDQHYDTFDVTTLPYRD